MAHLVSKFFGQQRTSSKSASRKQRSSISPLESRLLFSANPIAADPMMAVEDVQMVESLFEPSAFTEHAKQPRSAAAAPIAMAVNNTTPIDNTDDSPFVLQLQGTIDFSGEPGDHIEIAHKENMQIDEGTVSFTFTADTIWDRNTLFSKDFSDNRDGGDLTAFVKNGRVEVRLQSAEESVWLKSAEGSIAEGQEYHLAITFGENGFWLYIDGEMRDWETDFEQGLAENTQNLVIGANTWGRTEDRPDKTWHHFDGQIADFTIYSEQLEHDEVAEMAGVVEDEPHDEPTVVDDVLEGTQGDDLLDAAAFGVTEVFGGYGNDILIGTGFDDVLNGGHGEDRLEGGDGDDLLISRSDGREPRIAQDYDNEDDPDNEIDPLTYTYYSDQPIVADDILIGGAGADTFRFEVLINAKEDIILEHVMDNGMIHWHGVAGENDRVHDHWVDRLGNEVIWDFSRAEGDKIEVVGHTVDVYKIEHVDHDGDGMLDASVLFVQSNQGNAGAHNKDQLGTITVFGDLVTETDITVNAAPAYGIVDHIRDLDEAVTPIIGIPVSLGDAPPETPDTLDDGELPADAVFGFAGTHEFSGERGDHLEVAHQSAMELSEGTVSLSFSVDTIWDRQALFSKDFSGNRDGGDLTAFVRDGRIEVRLQSAEESVWLKTTPGSIVEGQEHHLALTFGEDGFWLYLDGEMKDWETDFTQGLAENTQNLVIGANGWGRNEDRPDKAWNHLDGQITDFTIFDQQFDHNQVRSLAGYEPEEPNDQPTVVDGVLHGTHGDDTLDAAAFGVTEIHAGYGDDLLIGTDFDDVLNGGHGEDRLEGGAGNDLLISRSDGREPQIAQNYGPDDDPDNEIDPLTNTYYSDQPIVADDILIGGAGADTFRFEVLINAKEDIILEHVMDNGMIHWHGVAGENDRVHDHWVDRLGNEVIWDFSRAEGDKIEVVGHTVDVYALEHIDSDGDGMLDASVLYVQSNQGNAGAHNKDQLGTITVFGDLVMESDITVDAAPAYGIVDHIRDLDEAITPISGKPVSLGDDPPLTPQVDDGVLPENGVIGFGGTLDFTGEHGDHIEISHKENLELTDGAVTMTFTVDTIWGRQALFSKDYSDNRDGGDITAFVRDGRIEVRLQSADESVWLKTTPGSIVEGREHHLAVTFGEDGFWLYLDGEMKDWETDFTQGLGENTQNLVIGANTWSRNEDRPDKTSDNFDGRITDFTVYGLQLSRDQVATLAGVSEDEPLEVPTVIDGVLRGTENNDILSAAGHGVTEVFGDYGDDTILGSSGNDILDGGHGEDRIDGRDGDDLLISRADGREPRIAQTYELDDDPYNEINSETRTYYPNQPILADDILIGGAGADTFRFETVINAKEDIILEHVMDNGMIHWHGVAGENDNVHDHWAERLGNEVIWDFNRAEGDKIEIAGHTIDAYKLEHIDTNDDGILDASAIHLQSNQGNAGAHNKDQLGTITVFGDLVMESDYTVDAAPAYGIIDHIRDLDEAITPKHGTPVSEGDAPPATPIIGIADVPAGTIFGFQGDVAFSGNRGDHLEVSHDEDMELAEGSFAMTFSTDNIWERQAIFSKDFSGNRDGGDLTAFVHDGHVEVRFQSADKSVWLCSEYGSVEEGEEYHMVVTFGANGFQLFLNGVIADSESEFTQGMEMNNQNLVIGANGWARNEDRPDKTWDHFSGRISDFTITDRQFTAEEVALMS
ncbi:MAG: LamG-like jellyroll fold domain-containing protein [Planctomycetota bacterium]